eukprot:7341165-Prymnesium_polylepis.1
METREKILRAANARLDNIAPPKASHVNDSSDTCRHSVGGAVLGREPRERQFRHLQAQRRRCCVAGERAYTYQATAVGNQATTVGNQATAEGNQATTVGNQATAVGNQATTVGNQATTVGNQATAVGNQATA